MSIYYYPDNATTHTCANGEVVDLNSTLGSFDMVEGSPGTSGSASVQTDHTSFEQILLCYFDLTGALAHTTFGMSVNLSSVGGNPGEFRFKVIQGNSGDCTHLEESTPSATVATSTGVHTATINFDPSVAWASGHKLIYCLEVQKVSGMAITSIAASLGHASTYLRAYTPSESSAESKLSLGMGISL